MEFILNTIFWTLALYGLFEIIKPAEKLNIDDMTLKDALLGLKTKGLDFDKKYDYVCFLNKYLKEELSKINKVHINSNSYCVPHIVNISIENIKPETMQHTLEQEEIYVSTQTACSSNNPVSKAVLAVTKNKNYASSSIRISLSYLTTKEEIDMFVKVLNNKIKELS